MLSVHGSIGNVEMLPLHGSIGSLLCYLNMVVLVICHVIYT